MNLLQIYEDDLQRLEYAMPRIVESLGAAINRPDLQVLVEECKSILSNVRWNYGPHSNVAKVGGE